MPRCAWSILPVQPRQCVIEKVDINAGSIGGGHSTWPDDLHAGRWIAFFDLTGIFDRIPPCIVSVLISR